MLLENNNFKAILILTLTFIQKTSTRLRALQNIQFRQHLCTVYPFTKNRCRGLPLHCLLVWLSVWTLLIHWSYWWVDRVLREAKSLPVNTPTVYMRGEYTIFTHTQIQILTGLATSGEGPRGLLRSWACSWMLAPPSEALRPRGPMPLSSCRVGGCSNDCSWRISSAGSQIGGENQSSWSFDPPHAVFWRPSNANWNTLRPKLTQMTVPCTPVAAWAASSVWAWECAFGP